MRRGVAMRGCTGRLDSNNPRPDGHGGGGRQAPCSSVGATPTNYHLRGANTKKGNALPLASALRGRRGSPICLRCAKAAHVGPEAELPGQQSDTGKALCQVRHGESHVKKLRDVPELHKPAHPATPRARAKAAMAQGALLYLRDINRRAGLGLMQGNPKWASQQALGGECGQQVAGETSDAVGKLAL